MIMSLQEIKGFDGFRGYGDFARHIATTLKGIVMCRFGLF